jgi:hypothetical protein
VLGQGGGGADMSYYGGNAFVGRTDTTVYGASVYAGAGAGAGRKRLRVLVRPLAAAAALPPRRCTRLVAAGNLWTNTSVRKGTAGLPPPAAATNPEPSVGRGMARSASAQ